MENDQNIVNENSEESKSRQRPSQKRSRAEMEAEESQEAGTVQRSAASNLRSTRRIIQEDSVPQQYSN